MNEILVQTPIHYGINIATFWMSAVGPSNYSSDCENFKP
jgi:hypothetical protein